MKATYANPLDCPLGRGGKAVVVVVAIVLAVIFAIYAVALVLISNSGPANADRMTVKQKSVPVCVDPLTGGYDICSNLPPRFTEV